MMVDNEVIEIGLPPVMVVVRGRAGGRKYVS